VAKPSNGWYSRVDKSTGEFIGSKVREKETLSEEFWKPIFDETDFASYLKESFSIGGNKIIELDIENEA